MTEITPKSRFACIYVNISADSEGRGTASHLDQALVGLTGRALEVGTRLGANFSQYPPTVTDIAAVKPDDILREIVPNNTYYGRDFLSHHHDENSFSVLTIL